MSEAQDPGQGGGSSLKTYGPELVAALECLQARAWALQMQEGLSRTALSRRAGVNQSYLTSILNNPRGPGKLVSSTIQGKVVRAIASAAVLDERRAQTAWSRLGTEEGVGEPIRETARRRSWAELTDIWDALCDEHPLVVASHSVPGQALRVDSPDYVMRQADKTADQYLKRSGAYFVIGPTESGRTSFLRRVEDLAHQAGRDTVYLDGRRLEVAGPELHHHVRAVIDGVIAAADLEVEEPIGRVTLSQSNRHLPSDVTAGVLWRWLGIWARSTKAVLLMDHLSEAWTGFIREYADMNTMDMPRGLGSLSIWYSMRGRGDSGYVSLDLPGVRLPLDWFSEQQVAKLAETFGVDGAAAWELFRGQPLVTHQFLTDLQIGTAESPSRNAKAPSTAGAARRWHLGFVSHESGVFRRHVRKLARRVLEEPPPSDIESCAAWLGGDSAEPPPFVLRAYGVASDQGYRCPLYELYFASEFAALRGVEEANDG